MTGRKLRIAVCIATRGRPAILAETVRALQRQTRLADRIVICSEDPADVASVAGWRNIELVKGAKGLTIQRNILLDATPDCDVVLFLDDDFLVSSEYISAIEDVFIRHPDVISTTGRVIADGAKGPGLSYEFAQQLLTADQPYEQPVAIRSCWSAYGCNMAVRASLVRKLAVRFDERLALYGWYEDIDFTRRLAAHGKVVQVLAARGVHLGVKLGRTSGRQLGYSQVINCIYLARKGSYPWEAAFRSIFCHLLVNFTRSFWPEAWVDRRGRFTGNLMAIWDACRGVMAPERVLAL